MTFKNALAAAMSNFLHRQSPAFTSSNCAGAQITELIDSTSGLGKITNFFYIRHINSDIQNKL